MRHLLYRGDLSTAPLSDRLCNGEALNGSTFTALKGPRGDPKENHYLRKQKCCRRGRERGKKPLKGTALALLPAFHADWKLCVAAVRNCARVFV